MGMIPDFVRKWYMQRLKPSEWASVEEEENRRNNVIKHTRQMMSHAARVYRDSVRTLQGQELRDFTATQSPKLIMSRMRGVTELMAALDDQTTWDMLSRPEQRYIADVYSEMQK
jgi:hypothetical protein